MIKVVYLLHFNSQQMVHPRHQFCPESVNLWCKWQVAKATRQRVSSQKNESTVVPNAMPLKRSEPIYKMPDLYAKSSDKALSLEIHVDHFRQICSYKNQENSCEKPTSMFTVV